MSSALRELPPLIEKRRRHRTRANMRRYPALYVMAGIGVVWFIIFKYVPMAGVSISLLDYRPAAGFAGSEWLGLENFARFFRDPFAFRIVRNTFLLAFHSLLWGFAPPIILALLLNELYSQRFKRIAQSVSYLPHFVSTVVVVGLITMLTAGDGVINNLFVKPFTAGTPILFMTRPEWFRPLYVASGIWQEMGWSSIIYLAAISGIDPELYEAAKIDGANRVQAIFRITLPIITPTIMVLLILNTGQLLRVGFEKVYLMYNPATFETADVIATYVYRVGIISGVDFSYATAIGLFEGVVSLIMVVAANYISRRITGESVF